MVEVVVVVYSNGEVDVVGDGEGVVWEDICVLGCVEEGG